MLFRPWEFLKQSPGDDDNGGGGSGQGHGTSTSFDTEADDAAAREGDRILAEEGDELQTDDSESEDEEHSPEQDLEQEEEEAPEPIERSRSYKDKSGNWDWQKIGKAISPDLEKSFKEASGRITKVEQENVELRNQTAHVPALQQRVRLLDTLDEAFHTNPEFRAAATKALGLGTNMPGEQDFELPEGVNPKDPLVPLIMRQQRMLDQFANQQRMSQQERQSNEVKAVFLQGLKDAKASFLSHVGREPTEAELRSVAQKMQQTRHFAGQDWIPSLFTKEIREKIQADLSASRNGKRNLPARGRRAVAGAGTQESTNLRDAFEDAWNEFG